MRKQRVMKLKPIKPIKPLKRLPIKTCYVRKPFMMKNTGTVVRQSIICRKS
jgi:hypothetical protein